MESTDSLIPDSLISYSLQLEHPIDWVTGATRQRVPVTQLTLLI